ncbi:glycoside hydrolase domain-containing protein [Sphingobacterium spiritivorum]|uniref:DUF4091 domain-containing protein n=1 Tax=Sphingobacterium spiritivorum TaxID=258 RepID=UPI003DA3939B
MKKSIITSLSTILILGFSPILSQTKTDSYTFQDDYTELSDPAKNNPEEWSQVKEDINITFANSNIRYAKKEVPSIVNRTRWKATGWKGEKLNTQLLIWSKRNLQAITVSMSSLKDKFGNIIDASQIEASFIRYVMTDIYQPDCVKKNKTNEVDSSLVADIIDTAKTTFLIANSVQPVWLSLNIPQDAIPGLYKGSITIQADSLIRTLDINIQVINHTLPNYAHFSFDLDMWQHPAAIARVHQLELWSDAHFKAMRPYYEILAKAGQKVITVAITDEPWGHQTYDDYPGMIRITRKKNGKWAYDYSLFDKYVSFVKSCGITQRINCYSMVSWDKKYHYYDESTQKDTSFTANTQDIEYREFWLAMLKDFAIHLKQKGWFDKTTVAMDERPLNDMQAALKLLKEADTDWKVSLAGRYHHELINDVYDYSVFKTDRFTPEELLQRKIKGWPSTYYTSCEGNFPNLFTFSSPAEAVWLSWQASAKGFTGYLRWAFNSWPKQPLLDSRFISWPAGDTFQIYPGPRSSVRFEKLIEGIQDFEKIRILKDIYTNKNDLKSLKRLNNVLSIFENIPSDQNEAIIKLNKAKEVLNK